MACCLEDLFSTSNRQAWTLDRNPQNEAIELVVIFASMLNMTHPLVGKYEFFTFPASKDDCNQILLLKLELVLK